MARYAAAVTKTTSASAAWQLQIRQTSAARNLRVLEVGVFTTTAVATTLTLERSLTVGATFTSTTLKAEDPLSSAGGGVIDTAITTAPTREATPVPFRSVTLPATIGSGMVWTFGPDGLVIPASGGLLLWQLTTAAVGLNFYVATAE